MELIAFQEKNVPFFVVLFTMRSCVIEYKTVLPGYCHGDTNILRMHFTPNISI